jgi:hypothetical protein
MRDVDTRRVAACVNACEGIPTEALECQSKKQITQSMISMIEEMSIVLKWAIARVELANKEGNPILSTWRESAEDIVERAEAFIVKPTER